MAEFDIGDATEVVDKRLGRGTSGVSQLAEVNNATSTSAMRTRLAVLDGTYFNTSRLNTMTKNDLLYALRVRSSDLAGI